MKHLFVVLALCLQAQAFAAQNVVVVLDDSSSMESGLASNWKVSRMVAAKTGLCNVVKGLSPDTQLGIVCLNGNHEPAQWTVPLSPLNKQAALNAIGRVEPNGGTPLGGTMKVAADALLKVREKEHYGTYRLLVVTDGQPTDGNLTDVYIPDIMSRGIMVDVIGIEMPEGISLATKVHNYRNADNTDALRAAIATTFAETNAKDAGEDYDIVSAWSDQQASEVLKVLLYTDNSPIGSPRPVTTAENASAAPATVPDGMVFLGGILAVIIIAVIVIALLLLANS